MRGWISFAGLKRRPLHIFRTEAVLESMKVQKVGSGCDKRVENASHIILSDRKAGHASAQHHHTAKNVRYRTH